MHHKDMEVKIPGILENYMDIDNENTSSIYNGLQLESLPTIYKYHTEHWNLCVTPSSENNEVPVIIFDLSTNQESWELDLSWQNISIPDPHL